MLKRFLRVNLILIYIFALVSINIHAKEINPRQKLEAINNLIEELEYNLKEGNLLDACKQAKKASKEIGLNLKKLKKLEPNYAWKEIKMVLLNVPKRYCK